MSRRSARLRSFLCALLGRRRFERDMDLEMAAHLEARAADLVGSGVPLEAARRQARREFGDPVFWKELGREARGLRLVDDIRADVRFAGRLLRRTPAFSLAAILTIALGIGANTAIFSLVDTVLLKMLPVQHPQSLVFLEVRGSQGGGGAPPYPAIERLRQQPDVFAGISAFASDELAVTVDGSVEQVFGQVASGNTFELLGMRAEAGRLLTSGDERLDPPVAVIGYRYWQRRFGGAPSAIGRTFSYGDRVFTIVGVTPPAFHGLQPGRELDVTLPITHNRDMMRDAGAWWLDAIARLSPGATVAQARARADATFQGFMRERGSYGEMRRTHFDHLEVVPAGRGLDRLRARFFAPLAALMALAAVVLLIACVNLANLLHARGVARSRELAIRRATGAGRGRLIRQLLTETLALFGVGGLAGVVAAVFAARALTGFVAIGRQPIELDVQFDWRLAAFAAVATLVTGVATGLWPALRALRSAPIIAMKAGAAGLAGGRHDIADRALLVGQVALSLVLTVTAMLFVRTLVNLRGVDLGFRDTRVLTMSVRPMRPDGSDTDDLAQFWQRTLEHVRATSGIRAASLSVLTPLSGRDVGKVISVAGSQPQGEMERLVHVNHVSEDYFRVFGIPLLAGRVLAASDTALSPKVVVINQSAARFYFPGRSPIGESIDFGNGEVYQVVGVVADQKHLSLRDPAARFAFVSLWQPLDRNVRVTLSVTSALEAAALARDVTAAVHAVQPDTLVSDVLVVDEQIDAALVSERLLSTLGSGFAALALGLAAIGLYGVLSYSVIRRRAEIGVRLALGATPSRVAWAVVRRALVDTAAGTAIGVPVAWIVAHAARGLLFGIAPDAAAPYVLGAAVLCAMAVLTALGPARRASSVDPLDALREP
jgi:predicted permease